MTRIGAQSNVSGLSGSTASTSADGKGNGSGGHQGNGGDDPDGIADSVVVIPRPVSNTGNCGGGGGGHPYRPSELDDRAVHVIRLANLEQNYRCVESAAARQKCSVITVVKADGYGHGAIATALHLADSCGADAFAVATLEEAIGLRRAFEQNPPGRWSKQLASRMHVSGGLPSHPSALGHVNNAVGGTVMAAIGLTSESSSVNSRFSQEHVAAARCRSTLRLPSDPPGKKAFVHEANILLSST
jgi:Alanine racemase, N-terminal domain